MGRPKVKMSSNRDKELQAELAKELAEQQLKAAKHVEQTREFFKKKEQARKMMIQFKFKEAREEILEPLLKSLKTDVNFGKEHPITLKVKFKIGVCFYDEQDWKQAKSMFKHTLKLMERKLGKTDKQTLLVKGFLAGCLIDLDQNKKALAMLKELLPVQKAFLGKDYILTKVTERSIAKLMIQDEKSRKDGLEMLGEMLARRLKDKLQGKTDMIDICLAIRDQLPLEKMADEDPDGERMILVKRLMTNDNQLSDDRDNCLALFKEFLALQEKTLGKDHEDTKDTREFIHELMTGMI